MRRLVAAGAGAAAVLLSACGSVDAAVDRAQDAAVDRAEEAIEDAVDDAADQVVDRGLNELDDAGVTCGDFTEQSDSARQDQMEALLTAFWLADLETSGPGAEVVSAYTQAVEAGCAGSPDSSLASVVDQVYASGQYSP